MTKNGISILYTFQVTLKEKSYSWQLISLKLYQIMVQWALSGLLLVKYTETTRNVQHSSSHHEAGG